MAVDIRATVNCSLGPLISGSISDDYLQGTGLIKYRGNVEIADLISPSQGSIVTFTYTKDGVTRNIPRKLRVLSSFADPYRNTTKVELGCKLTYLSDLKERLEWNPFNDPVNTDYTAEDERIITLPIYASSIMQECLLKLGITATSIPLTNKFSIGKFDFSPGYVQVLSDLLVSESYFGSLNFDEVLKIRNLAQEGEPGLVIGETDIVDIGPIGVGQLPGDAVVVYYSTLKLKEPDPPPDPENPTEPTDPTVFPNDPDGSLTAAYKLWEYSYSYAGPNYYVLATNTYSGSEITETRTTFLRINNSDLPVSRVTTETAATAKVGGSIGADYVKNQIEFNNFSTTLREEYEEISYDAFGNKIQAVKTTYATFLELYGSMPVTYVFAPPGGTGVEDYVILPTGLMPREKIITKYSTSSGSQQEVVTTYKAWGLTIPGQQAVAQYSGELIDAGQVASFINSVAGAGLVYERTVVNINQVGQVGATSTGGQVPGSRPDDVLNSTYADGGDPANNWRTESTSEFEVAVGSPFATRRIEFTLPYASDDSFSGPSGGPYTSLPSDAPQKAATYGRVQNRLLLGNRSGMNIQLAPDRLPADPFEPIFVSAAGLVGLYRANGNQWAFSSEGIVCSTDALYWGVVGTNG